MNVKMFSDEWVEGFAKEADALGLDQEQAKALLKYAAQQLLMEDGAFAQGFQDEMQKSAFLPGLMLPTMLAPGLLAGYAGKKIYDRFRPSFGNDTEGARLVRQMGGTSSADQMQEIMEKYNRRKMTLAAQKQRGAADFNKSLGEITGGGNSANNWWQ